MSDSANLPAPTGCAVRELLIACAARDPGRELMLFESGERWSAAETLERVRRHAAGFAALGVRSGDHVLSWLGNGPTAVLTFLALNYLNAVYVPINTGYRGKLLEHVLRNSGARLMVADGRLIDRLGGADRALLERVVVIGDERPALPGLTLLPASAVTAAGDDPPLCDIAPTDTHMVIYTSGTTGPSKGVLCSYLHSYTAATGFRNVGPGDRNLMQLPMFHVGGPYAILWALIHDGSTVVVEAFSVSRFWDIVRRFGITTVGLLGSMTQFLMKQPESPDDARHSLRSVIIAPFDENAIAFGRRFGVPTFTEFNMTELAVPLWAGPNPTLPGTCGRPRDGFELRIVDTDGKDVPAGASGELIVHATNPSTISHGYLNDPEATARAWQNGWFHTGDLFRRDADGNYFFLDRLKDAIRRRGENVSSFEVERAILEHPAVREAAVVAVPYGAGHWIVGDSDRAAGHGSSEGLGNAGAEDELLAVIALRPGAALAPADLVAFLRDRLAPFMIPRYVRMLDELPKTPTQKVEKHLLRQAGVTSGTWDRDTAGIHVGRDRLPMR